MRVAQDGRAAPQRGPRVRDHTGAVGDVAGEIRHAAGVDHPDDDLRHVVRETAQFRLGPDGGEGAAVDLGAVADVVKPRQPGTPGSWRSRRSGWPRAGRSAGRTR